MREIVIDTETTGLEPGDGHRLVEIGALELINHVPTGRVFHTYLNPERDMPADARLVHGLTAAFLGEQPLFAEVVQDFLSFLDPDGVDGVERSQLVIHNSAFDVAFLNYELARLGLPGVDMGRRVVDTLQLARQRFPGAPASLDALCRRFDVDAAARIRHGALLDAELLADVYLALIGGRQPDLGLIVAQAERVAVLIRERMPRAPRAHAPTPEELAAHQAFLTLIKDPIWLL
jgi:DNA polymerase III subunit epsilon